MNYRVTFFVLSFSLVSKAFAQYYVPESQGYGYQHSHQLVQPSYALSQNQAQYYNQIPQPYYGQPQQPYVQQPLPQPNQPQAQPPCAQRQLERPMLAQPTEAPTQPAEQPDAPQVPTQQPASQEMVVPDDQGLGTFPKERAPYKRVPQPCAEPQWVAEKWKWDGDNWVKNRAHWSNE